MPPLVVSLQVTQPLVLDFSRITAFRGFVFFVESLSGGSFAIRVVNHDSTYRLLSAQSFSSRCPRLL